MRISVHIERKMQFGRRVFWFIFPCIFVIRSLPLYERCFVCLARQLYEISSVVPIRIDAFLSPPSLHSVCRLFLNRFRLNWHLVHIGYLIECMKIPFYSMQVKTNKEKTMWKSRKTTKISVNVYEMCGKTRKNGVCNRQEGKKEDVDDEDERGKHIS